MKSLAVFVILLLVNISAYSQGTLRGKISDENGETLIGVTVVFKENRSSGTVTDFDGNFSLKFPDSSPKTIVISYISYEVLEETFTLKENEIVSRNFILKPASKAIGEVEITAKAVRANDYYMEKLKMNSATTLNYISAETMKKTGDASVVNAVARVSGVSTNSGFITVRGIGDRYVKTAVNGSVIPTLDPFTNNIKLDIFPSSLVDNVVITKTSNPDLPGDWSGAYLSLETKDYPDQLSVNAETSVGFNSQSTFKDFITTKESSTDRFGFDDGYRDRSHDNYQSVNANPTTFQEFVALGLGPYFQSLGVTGSWNEGSSAGNAYFKLGLVQLGLLAPAQFDDPVAVSNALNLYISGSYKSDAFQTINKSSVQSNQSFPNNWNSFNTKSPLNFSQSFSIGNQGKFLGKTIGVLFGLRYNSAVIYDSDGLTNNASVDVSGNRGIAFSTKQKYSAETNGWSALLNLAYKLNNNNSVSILLMPNFSGVNKVRYSLNEGTSQTYKYIITESQFYEERKQFIYQLKTEHYLPSKKLKVELNASYTNGLSDAPDFKFLTYFSELDGQYVIDTKESDTHRYYRYLKDNLFDSRLSFEFPLKSQPGLIRKLKFGGALQYNDKTSDQFDYRLVYNSGNLIIPNNDIETFFDASQFGFITNPDGTKSINRYYTEANNPSNKSIGNRKTYAGFILTDYAINPLLRVAGGLRIEKAEVFTDVFKYDSLGLAPNDPRRQFTGEIFTINPGKLDETSFLPTINLIYKLNPDEVSPINLRLGFSQSVARPSIRELSDIIAYDYELRDFVFGNSQLKMVNINNYDIRFESYFKSGNNFSVSAFYKTFRNHIELVNSNQGFSWQNVDESRVAGVELEGTYMVSRSIEASANITLVDSKTEFVQTELLVEDGIKTYIPVDTVNRSMFGQAPYVINGMITYKNERYGFNATAAYNIQGAKLVVATTDEGIPDIFEMPRHLIDLKVSKTISKHFTLSLKVRDVLNTQMRNAYIYDDNSEVNYEKFRFGTNYILSISYKL